MKIKVEVDLLLQHIHNEIGEAEIDCDIKGIALVGSRITGTHSPESDLDVAIEYAGEADEDIVFEILNVQSPLIIDDMKVDFIPYSINRGNKIDVKDAFVLTI